MRDQQCARCGDAAVDFFALPEAWHDHLRGDHDGPVGGLVPLCGECVSTADLLEDRWQSREQYPQSRIEAIEADADELLSDLDVEALVDAE